MPQVGQRGDTEERGARAARPVVRVRRRVWQQWPGAPVPWRRRGHSTVPVTEN